MGTISVLGTLACCACGRALSNVPAQRGESDNRPVAHWTHLEPRLSYCGNSPQCEKDALAEEAMSAGAPW